MSAAGMLDVLSWLLLAGFSLALLIWFVIVRLDAAERERENEARGRYNS